MRLLPSLPRRAPTLAVKAINQTSTTVEVTSPSTTPAGGWASLQLNVCLQSNSSICIITNQTCTVQTANATATNCTVGGLQHDTQYIIEVRGHMGLPQVWLAHMCLLKAAMWHAAQAAAGAGAVSAPCRR